MIARLAKLLRDQRGTVIIETAIVAPVLALLGLGAFQVSQAYARQHELQTGADDAAAVAMAGWSTANSPTQISDMLKRTLSLNDDQVAVTVRYRCGTTTAYVINKDGCGTGVVVATYLTINLTDTYTPLWTGFGVGQPIAYNVSRTVVMS